MGDPGAEFAALMSNAATAATPAEDPAPYGFTRDRATGELRPKKVPGRPRARPPSVEELKAAAENPEAAPEAPPAEDRAPDEKRARGRAPVAAAGGGDSETAYVPGRIAKGMNRLYRRAGKIVKAFDPAVGAALIEVTRKDDDDDVTVGDAWEEIARTNPRIRRFLNRLIAGGAWGQLAAAHAPIVLAVLMKPAVLDRIPFSRLIEALITEDDVLDQDDDSQPGPGPGAGLTGADIAEMAGLIQGLAGRFRTAQAAGQAATLAPMAA